MRKAIIATCAAALFIAAGAYFGSDLWAQFRTKNDVEAVFNAFRTTFTTATHGKIAIYRATRSVKVPDVVLQTADKTTTIKMAEVIGVGTRGPTGGRVGAGRIEITDWELTTTIAGQDGPTVSYKAPKIIIEAFSGPAALPVKVDPTSPIDVTRGCLEYVAASSANSITIPKLVATVAPASNSEQASPLGPVEYTYTDIVFRSIGNRRVAEITTDRVTATTEIAGPGPGSFAMAMANFKLADFNFDGPIALLDPAKANDDSYIAMYGQSSVGPIEIRSAKGGGLKIEGFAFDGIAIRPSKLSWSKLMTIVGNAPKPGTSPAPEKVAEMLDTVAGFYEGIRINKMEMRNLVTDVPQTPSVKIAAMRFSNFENGRLGEFAIEGIDGSAGPKEPIHVGRFALKGLRFAEFMRQAGKLASNGPATPSVAQSLILFSMLEGIEFKDIVGSNPLDPSQQVRIDNFEFAWGKFVGPIPTTIRLTTKMTLPTSLADPSVRSMLSDAGMQSMTSSSDIGLAWDEASQTLTLSPALIEIENAFSFSAKFAINNVTRDAFSIDMTQAMAAANLMEIGPLEISLRDTGAVKTALQQYAKKKNLSVDDARKEITDNVKEQAKDQAQQFPDAQQVADAIVQFIEKPGSTLSIKVTPKGKVNVNQVFGAASADPTAMSNMFAVEAKTTTP